MAETDQELCGKDYCAVVLRADQIEKIEKHCPDADWNCIQKLLQSGSIMSQCVDALFPV